MDRDTAAASGPVRPGPAGAGTPGGGQVLRRPARRPVRRPRLADRRALRGGFGPLRVDVLESLAHEIRTPMTTIYVAAKILAREGGRIEGGQRAEMLDAVELEAERLYRLLEDFLAVAGAADSLRSIGEPVLVQHVLRAVIADLTPALDSPRIHAVLPAGLAPVLGDADGLAHAARNLIERALDATPEREVVEVVVRPTAASIAVHVYDNGSGPGPATPFTGFEPSRPGAATPGPGRALGLAATRALVEAMGGRTWATGRPHGGTETGFELPLFGPERATARTRRRHEARRRGPDPRGRARRRIPRRRHRPKARQAR